MLALAIIMIASAAVPEAGKHEALRALMALNNYEEALNFSDACLGQRNSRIMKPLAARIEAARSQFAERYPDFEPIAAGDTDYICDRERATGAADRAAIRREVLRLIVDLEAAVRR